MADASAHGDAVSSVSSSFSREVAISRVVQTLGVSPQQGERLYELGLQTPEDVRKAPDDILREAGLSDQDIANTRQGTPMESGVSDDMLEKWLENRARSSRKKGAKTASAPSVPDGSDDTFRRWVAGDDSAFASWLKPTEPDRPLEPPVPLKEATPEPVAAPPVAPTPSVETHSTEPSPEKSATEGAPPPPIPAASPPLAPSGLKDEEFGAWVQSSLEAISAGKVDLEAFRSQADRFSAEIRLLRESVAKLSDTLTEVRKGAVAQIKFVRTREIRIKEEALAAKDAEIASLREQVASGKGAASAEGGKDGKTRPAPSSIAAMMEGVRAREKVLVAREEELQAREEELKLRLAEAQKLKNPLLLREQEIAKWEQDLRIKDEQLKAQMRKLEADRKATQDPQTLEKLRKIEDLEAEISRKEAEVKAKENYLAQRLDELQGKQREIVDLEVEKQSEDFNREMKVERAKTGVRRLDDLLIGGLPIGSNVLVNGTKHTGKEILSMYLVAEGLRRMVPALWVLTDTDPESVRSSMTAILPTYPEYERRGLIRYVDLYSSSLGNTTADEFTDLISLREEGALDKLADVTDAVAKKFLEKAKYYRLVFMTISTVTAHLEIPAMMRFLQPYAGKRRREKAVCYFLVETGMHEEGDIDFLGHLMDGSIELKVEQMKTFLSVKGILDSVQSRAWINYSFSKTTFEMGSFSLDHIR
jgi:KaiC/GvpD/RAD55 family RecA-like ATPase